MGSLDRGSPEEEPQWPQAWVSVPSWNHQCDLSAGTPITPQLPQGGGSSPVQASLPSPSHSLDFYVLFQHPENTTSL